MINLNPNIPETVRAVASNGTQLRYALMEMAAQQKDTIALGRGDPDLDTPAHIITAAQDAIRKNLTGATPVAGMPELREAIAEKLRRENGLQVGANNVIVTTGGQEGLFLIMQALLDPGDEVLVPDPRYTSYDEAIETAGGKIVMIPTDHEDAFNLPVESIVQAITPKTKALLIVTPSNPTGGIITEERARAIAEVAIKHNLIVISDEIYEKFMYDGWKHFSIGSIAGMEDRTITLNGFSKTYAMTGFRCGFVAAPVDFIEAMTRVKAFTTGPAATVSQHAGLAALTGPQEPIQEFLRIYTERRALMMKGLRDMGLDFSDPRGGFFLWTISSSTGINATELSYLMLKEGRVLIFPGTGFGEKWDGYLRITLLQSMDELEEALRRMKPVIEKYAVKA
ncbi:MAG: pyridoxal phosphate-dependent aminotransferase [Chloroflexi bacterium]|nr:pyridoxal phosphate-dependent aminotransferase [Chloroflexota bacterium]MCC6893156.1 pyridoxal phosphate-dependent aminotransferase [Anaerolineae bacterium]